jgi:hypothetical protein
MISIDRRWKPSGRSAARIAVVASVLLGAVVAPAELAGAQPQTKYYDAAATPATVYLGAPSPVTVSLENDPSSTQSFGSAELDFGTLPAGAVGPVSAGLAGWTSAVVSSNPLVVLLTSGSAPAVPPGAFLPVSFEVTAPTTASIHISTQVKQSNNFLGSGNEFTNLGPDPTISVVPATLAFVQQPSTVQFGSPAAPISMCPPVSVAVTAGPGGPGIPDVPVSLSSAGASNPGLYFEGQTSGISLTTNSAGLATFGTCANGLGATTIGAGYTLQASSPVASAPVTSGAFSVVQYDQPCNGSCTVTGLQSASTGTTAGVATTGSGTYGLVASFGQGGLECDSQVTTGVADPIFTQALPAAGGSLPYDVLSVTFPKAVVNSLPNNGTPLMQVCAGANVPFSGGVAAPGTAFAYQGLLPDCPSSYLGDPAALCVISRAKHAAAETIDIYVGEDYAGDPMFW